MLFRTSILAILASAVSVTNAHPAQGEPKVVHIAGAEKVHDDATCKISMYTQNNFSGHSIVAVIPQSSCVNMWIPQIPSEFRTSIKSLVLQDACVCRLAYDAAQKDHNADCHWDADTVDFAQEGEKDFGAGFELGSLVCDAA